MDSTILGRTGLKVSVMGLGCGGPSRVGKSTGKSERESIAIVQQALDAGINFIDTSELYRTEKIVGKAIKGYDRGSIVLSTKLSGLNKIKPEKAIKSLNSSLRRLNTDYIDIYHLHAPLLKDYEYFITNIVPTLQELRDEGMIRFLGITERFHADPQHNMLQRAVQDDLWDVVMVGFNILNQSARSRVFPITTQKDIGVLIMFAVRLALSRPERLSEVIRELIENNQVSSSELNFNSPLEFLVHENGANNIVDAAYRFCRYELGTHVTLSGTGNSDHLTANIESFYKPSLPQKDVERLKKLFQNVDSVSGQ